MTSSTGNANLSAAFLMAQQLLEPAFNKHFAHINYGKGLIELQYHALLHTAQTRVFGETKKYIKMSHTAQITSLVELPRDFENSDMIEKIATSLTRSFGRLKSLRIDDFDLEKFSADYANFAVREGWIALLPPQVTLNGQALSRATIEYLHNPKRRISRSGTA
ncbi:hypothetical protein [Massilia sp. DWR3-1-1]|uniref:hypothetical protein n=1 Tax=Massilia sp. DWR3-1-1 TaxID=2804559 RepID=UPI003CF508CD